MKLLCAIIALGLGLATRAAAAEDFASRYAVVMIDDVTLREFGAFPFDRSLYARALDRCRDLHAQTVVLKLFLDQPKTTTGDAALAMAMQHLPVILQARLDPSEPSTASIPARLALTPKLAAARADDHGWIPLAPLLENTAGLGFVDFDTTDIPLVENYRGTSFRSLIISILEADLGQRVDFSRSGIVRLEPYQVAVTPESVLHVEPGDQPLPDFISFRDLMTGKVTETALQGRIVIIGYNAANGPQIETRQGPVPAHVFFIRCLVSARKLLLDSAKPDASRGVAR